MANEDKKLRANALRWANRVRGMLGVDPVDHVYPGERSNPFACPITNTIYDDDLKDKVVVTTGAARTTVYERHPDTFRDQFGHLRIKVDVEGMQDYNYPAYPTRVAGVKKGETVNVDFYAFNQHGDFVRQYIELKVLAIRDNPEYAKDFINTFDCGEGEWFEGPRFNDLAIPSP